MDKAPWLGPFPDRLVADVASDPAARYSQLESVRLAFMVALHRLPPRQRAVLLLRDVLGWRAKEAAEQLDMTLARVNSALQRARVTLQHGYPDHQRLEESSVDEDSSLTQLVDHYMRAWEANDADALVQLLTEDASMSMPPAVMWLFLSNEKVSRWPMKKSAR
jgi:RNA polymerase sigma-70 factor (ECF subfamily)